MRVTNHGRRKWTIGGVKLRPGQSIDVTVDSWRLALDCNKALRLAGSEVAVEDEARPALETPTSVAPPAEPDALSLPVGSDDEGRPSSQARPTKKRGKR